MSNKNRYQKFSKISEQKFREILRFFATDLNASDTAQLTCKKSPRCLHNRLRKISLFPCTNCRLQSLHLYCCLPFFRPFFLTCFESQKKHFLCSKHLTCLKNSNDKAFSDF